MTDAPEYAWNFEEEGDATTAAEISDELLAGLMAGEPGAVRWYLAKQEPLRAALLVAHMMLGAETTEQSALLHLLGDDSTPHPTLAKVQRCTSCGGPTGPEGLCVDNDCGGNAANCEIRICTTCGKACDQDGRCSDQECIGGADVCSICGGDPLREVGDESFNERLCRACAEWPDDEAAQ